MGILDSFMDFEFTYMVRLLAALFLGGLIGIERQSRGRAAGLRTNILVCLGSAAVVLVFQKLYLDTSPDAASAIRIDPARAAAGVITGIGFLGAGTIVKTESFVRGLTTAASIWVVSAVGIAVGLGEYAIGVVLTVLVILTLFALDRIPLGSDHYSQLRLAWHGDFALIDEVEDILQAEEVTIKHRSVTRHPGDDGNLVGFSLRYHGSGPDRRAFARLQADHRFDEISWS